MTPPKLTKDQQQTFLSIKPEDGWVNFRGRDDWQVADQLWSLGFFEKYEAIHFSRRTQPQIINHFQKL